jgi:hypothetical protein
MVAPAPIRLGFIVLMKFGSFEPSCFSVVYFNSVKIGNTSTGSIIRVHKFLKFFSRIEMDIKVYPYCGFRYLEQKFGAKFF